MSRFKSGHIPWIKGKKASEETRHKQSIAKIGYVPWNKGKGGYKLKITKQRKGVKLSEHRKNIVKLAMSSPEVRARMSLAKKGKPSPNKGKIASLETRIKQSIARKGRRTGAKCNFWRGGISNSPYSSNWGELLKRVIRERDNYTCRMCSSPQLDKTFDVHHIDYDKKNSSPNNLILLCRKCHVKTTNGDRNMYKEHLCKMLVLT